jgi:hypothetical protein
MGAVLLLDNSPGAVLPPENALACGTFVDDLEDAELPALAEFLEAAAEVEVRMRASEWRGRAARR